MHNELDRAREALYSIPPDCDRDTWVKSLMGAKDAGLDFETVNDWSAGAGNYQGERDVQAVWRSIKPGGGVTAIGAAWAIQKANGGAAAIQVGVVQCELTPETRAQRFTPR